MEYLATFHTHYGAVRFYKYCQKNGVSAKMAPVPRELSASCGTCVYFKSQYPPVTAEHEDMERSYAIAESGAYMPMEDKENGYEKTQ